MTTFCHLFQVHLHKERKLSNLTLIKSSLGTTEHQRGFLKRIFSGISFAAILERTESLPLFRQIFNMFESPQYVYITRQNNRYFNSNGQSESYTYKGLRWFTHTKTKNEYKINSLMSYLS